MKESDLTSCIVRILRNGETVATGFLAGDGSIVITCAHVIAKAGEKPVDPVQLVFHATGESTTATIAWDCWRDEDEEDVAVLRLDRPAPEQASPVVLAESSIPFGRVVRTFGFPNAKAVEGLPGTGTAIGSTTENGFPVLTIQSGEITSGFSGAPAFDAATGRAIGMITSVTWPDDKGRLADVAFITPAETLANVCNLLRMPDVLPPPWPPFERLDGAGLRRREADRFLFTSRRTTFHGRSAELAELQNFIGSPASFTWLGLTGPGGAGKSRTAFRLLESLGRGWHGGFLERGTVSDRRWDEWRPLRPTLIMIDDADVAVSDAARTLTATLASRAAALPGGLGWPVRLLVIGRSLEFMPAASSDVERERLAQSRYSEDLELTPMQDEDLAALVSELISNSEVSSVDAVLAEVHRIDPERRPLFVQFVAEAVRDNQMASSWDRVDLLRWVLQREQDRRWRPGAVTDEDRRVVMFGTLCAPLPTARLTAGAKPYPSIGVRLDSQQKRRIRMLGSAPANKMVPSLRPDILGTMFILEELQSLEDDNPDLKAECMALAWRLNPDATNLATRRAVDELSRHPQTCALLDAEPEVSTFPAWVRAAAFVIERRHLKWREVSGRVAAHRASLIEYIEHLIEEYKASRDANALMELWDLVLCLLSVNMADHRLEHHELWLHVLALPLPHHSLGLDQTYEDVKGNSVLLANLLAVFAAWGETARDAGRALYFMHRHARDRHSAKAVVEALASKAATLSPVNRDTFDGNWLEYVASRRHSLRTRLFALGFRPCRGGTLLSQVQIDLLERTIQNVASSDKTYRFNPAHPESFDAFRKDIEADIEFGFMLVENGLAIRSSYARDLIDAIERSTEDPELVAVRQEFLHVANQLLEAATHAGPVTP